jgi:hypothetical protein
LLRTWPEFKIDDWSAYGDYTGRHKKHTYKNKEILPEGVKGEDNIGLLQPPDLRVGIEKITRQCVVIATGNDTGNKHLLAYLILRNLGKITGLGSGQFGLTGIRLMIDWDCRNASRGMTRREIPVVAEARSCPAVNGDQATVEQRNLDYRNISQYFHHTTKI